ncbi:MAG: Flagellar hook protein FlgE [candidate division BRC1 bacterium ADurb.BinA364]|nr:MAG: Flagellar hook protein FlgE [candidate division BRC1 bacterium ADurb.BinA364]
MSAPNTGATGSVSGNSLESSNVDLSNEFVTLIINQRAFQANSRIVSTGNDMLQVIVQLGQ